MRLFKFLYSMLRICLKGLLALGVAILSFASAVAVPAYPGKIKAVQPDGTEIEIVLQGDEHFNWARTTDGYTLLRDENNYWALACQDANGMLVASKHIFRNDTRVAVEAGIERGLYFSQAQIDAVSEKKSVENRCPVDKETKREEVKQLIYNMAQTYPDLKERIFGAMQRYPLPEWEPHGRYKRPKEQ